MDSSRSCTSITCYEGSVKARVRALEARAATGREVPLVLGSKTAPFSQRASNSSAPGQVESCVTKSPPVKSRNRNKCHQAPGDSSEATAAAGEASRLELRHPNGSDVQHYSSPDFTLAGAGNVDVKTVSERPSCTGHVTKSVEWRKLSPVLAINPSGLLFQAQGQRVDTTNENSQTVQHGKLSGPGSLDVTNVTPGTSPASSGRTVKARVKAMEEEMWGLRSKNEFLQQEPTALVLDQNLPRKCSRNIEIPDRHTSNSLRDVHNKHITNGLKSDPNNVSENFDTMIAIKQTIHDHRASIKVKSCGHDGNRDVYGNEGTQHAHPRAGGLASLNPSREFVQECVHALETVGARASNYRATDHVEQSLGTASSKDEGKAQFAGSQDERQFEARRLNASINVDYKTPVRITTVKNQPGFKSADQETGHGGSQLPKDATNATMSLHATVTLPTLPDTAPDDSAGPSASEDLYWRKRLPDVCLEQQILRVSGNNIVDENASSDNNGPSSSLFEETESYRYQVTGSLQFGSKSNVEGERSKTLDYPGCQEAPIPRLSTTEDEGALEHPSISRVHFNSCGEVEVGDVTASSPQLSSGRDSFARVNTEILKVTLLTLGIATAGGAMKTLIPRNTRIPTKKVEAFSTFLDDQTQVRIQIFEGERYRTKHNKLLGSFTVSGIPAAPRGAARILVSFDVDAQGILTVLVKGENARFAAQKLQVATCSHSGENGLNTNLVKEMLQDAEKNRAKDEEDRLRICAKNCFETYAFRIRDWITDERICKKLKASEKEKVEGAVACAIDWVLYKSWLFHCHDRLGQVTEFDCKLGELKGICGPVLEKIDSLIDLDLSKTDACTKILPESQ